MPVTPRASILVAVRDRERYLPLALDSALAQTCPDFELLVWDDASSDRSADIARAYAARDARVRLVSTERRGLNGAMRALIEAAEAPALGFLDSDDLLERRAIEDTLAVLDEDPEVGLVYTDYVTIDVEGKVRGYGSRCKIPYSPERLLVDFMTFHFRLFRKSAYDATEGLDPARAWAPDYDLCLRLSEKVAFAHVPAPRYFYRIHDGMMSTARDLQAACAQRAAESALARRGLDKELVVEPIATGHRLRPR
uniref:Glycosyl transferase family 2 n=1 Tax=Chondromyces catenulatus TaxID=1653841 RepID=A0A3S7UZC7_9BACT|nr:glycosyl transferase family 2 [Chondromyces catenulatus]